jgi:glucose/arabinose dehydrogenase
MPDRIEPRFEAFPWRQACGLALAAGLAVLGTGARPASPAETLPRLAAEPIAAFGPDELPTDLRHALDGRLYVTLKHGVVRVLEDGVLREKPFLDIRQQVGSPGEAGLVSLAFPPDHADSGLLYLNYTDRRLDTVLARYRLAAGEPLAADPDTETVLLRIPQPEQDHNGAQMRFGPDGFLYVGMGDGGGFANPSCSAQRGDSLLGKILRLDVHVAEAPYYRVPEDNPFVGQRDPQDAIRDEVWALGLRNPWRLAFEPGSGALWVADVGELYWEEVNRVPAGGGTNLGWMVMEGTDCTPYSKELCPDDMPACPGDPRLSLPVYRYGHEAGNCAIIGGVVYRGSLLPALQGRYVFGDHCSGRIWALEPGTGAVTELLRLEGPLLTFGEDLAGELYVASGAALLRLVPASPTPAVAGAGLASVMACLAAAGGAGRLVRRRRAWTRGR